MPGRKITCWPSLKADLKNAGADGVDRGLLTSRSPDDAPAFNRVMVEVFGRAGGQARSVA